MCARLLGEFASHAFFLVKVQTELYFSCLRRKGLCRCLFVCVLTVNVVRYYYKYVWQMCSTDSALACHCFLYKDQNWGYRYVHYIYKVYFWHMTVDLSCITLHVRELNNMRKRRKIFWWLHGRRFQVIFLQEVYGSKDLEKLWSAEWGGKIVYCHGTKHSSGTLIMFNPSLDVEVATNCFAC